MISDNRSANFLKRLNETRIGRGKKNLIEFPGEKHLAGSAFLNVASSSGLSAFAARHLGVTSASGNLGLRSVTDRSSK
jgi:hypothetical protein